MSMSVSHRILFTPRPLRRNLPFVALPVTAMVAQCETCRVTTSRVARRSLLFILPAQFTCLRLRRHEPIRTNAKIHCCWSLIIFRSTCDT